MSTADGGSRADVHLVPGTGTGALTGITGEGTLTTGAEGSTLALDDDLS